MQVPDNPGSSRAIPCNNKAGTTTMAQRLLEWNVCIITHDALTIRPTGCKAQCIRWHCIDLGSRASTVVYALHETCCAHSLGLVSSLHTHVVTSGRPTFLRAQKLVEHVTYCSSHLALFRIQICSQRQKQGQHRSQKNR